MNELIHDYNTYMETMFNNNQVLIAIVTGALISIIIGMVYKIPRLLRSITYRYLLTPVRIDSGDVAYFNIMERVFEDLGVIKSIGHYSIQSGVWGRDRTLLTVGTGARLVRIEDKIVLVRTRLTKMDNKFVTTITFYVPKYRGHAFAKWLQEMGGSSLEVSGTYLVSQTIGLTQIRHRQPYEHKESLVITDAVSRVLYYVDNFVNNKDFYINNGIPYKLGLLLDGIPGSGKTSLVRHIASMYGFDIIVIRTIDNLDKLAKATEDVCSNKRVMVLIEEIDLLININRDDTRDTQTTASDNRGLSRVLQALDGIISTPGRLLIGTTNYGEMIDKALTRPGRFDHTITFDYLTVDEFQLFYKKYYKEDIPVHTEQGKTTIIPCTPVMLQQDFLTLTKSEFLNKYLV